MKTLLRNFYIFSLIIFGVNYSFANYLSASKAKDVFPIFENFQQTEQPYFVDVNPADNAVGVTLEEFQITVGIVLPSGYELDEATLSGNVSLFELTSGGEIAVPANINDTGGGDAVTLSPLNDLKENTTYIFRLSESIEANLLGDTNDRLAFLAFESTFTTGEFEDNTNTSSRDLTGVRFNQVFGESELGLGTEGQRFSSLVIGPDGKLYASTVGDFTSDGQIYRWDIGTDGTLTNLEILSPVLQGASHPITGPRNNDNRLIIGFVFDPASTPGNLIAYVTHSAAVITDGPEWDGVLTKLSGPNLSVVEDMIIHLPRSTKDHLTNSIAFDSVGDMYISQGSNTAGGEPDAAWSFRPERLLAGAVLKVELDKLTGTLPLSAYTTEDISVINNASSTSLTMTDGQGNTFYNPYATNSPLTIFATGVRNAYDLMWHSNGWLYVPTNGTAGNSQNELETASPNSPGTADYITPTVALARRIDGLTSIPDVPLLIGGETQKDWLFKTQGGSYHGHPNPYRGEFVFNHGGVPYSGIPGQENASDVDVDKYPDDLQPDPNYSQPAYDFGFNKSPNGVIEYKSTTFNNKLQGVMLVVRFSGQDDVLGLDTDANGDIIGSYNAIPGLGGFDDPLDLVEDPTTGNIYVSEYDRIGDGIPRLTLLQAITTGAEIAASSEELLFEITTNGDGATTDAKILTISNTGYEDLTISSASITGAFAGQFSAVSPSGNQVIASGESLDYTITYTPELTNTDLGYQNAILEIVSDDAENPLLEIGLYALKKSGHEGNNEPPLQDVVNTLGIGVDVGWTNLSNTTDPLPVGDEIQAELFYKVGSGPVTLTPVASYAPPAESAFGWYLNDSGTLTLNEVGVFVDGVANAQTLFPELLSGSNSFDPSGSVFGIYLQSNYFTQDELNTDVPHRVRVYPNKNRIGETIENSYLIGFEISTNGDYQDYVFVIDNVAPFEPSDLVLQYDPIVLEFESIFGEEDTLTQNVTLTGNGGIISSEVTLRSSQDWVVLPETVTLGTAKPISVDLTSLGVGSYSATVTASAPNYEDAVVTINLLITNEPVYTYQFNFQTPDDIADSPEGYIDDIGQPYGVKFTELGNLTFGWAEFGTETPAEAGFNARNRGGDPLTSTLTHVGHIDPNNFPTFDWLIDLPNGTYYANISVGDPDWTNSVHLLDVNGVTVVNYAQVNDPEGPENFSDTKLVEVTDGVLRLSLGEGGVNAKLNYIRLAPFSIDDLPPLVTVDFVGDSSDTDIYRGDVSISINAQSQNSSAIATLQYQLDGGETVDYIDAIIVSDLGLHTLTVTATDANGNSTQNTVEFTIEAESGALLEIENMTKIPGTDRGFPADDYYSFYRLGNPGNAVFHDSNIMRLNNTGTSSLVVTNLLFAEASDYSFEVFDSQQNLVSLPITIPAGDYADVDLTFIGSTGTDDNGMFLGDIRILSNADNASENVATLHAGYAPQPEGGDEIHAQQVLDAFGFQTSMLSLVNDQGTISPPNNVTYRPGSNFPLDENINAGYEGDMIYGDAYVQADPNQPVILLQIAALHGPGSNNARFVEVNSTDVVAGIDFNHFSRNYQTLLPKNVPGDLTTGFASSVSQPFRLAISDRYLSTGGNTLTGNRPDLLGVRLYKVTDHNGNLIPNEYIIIQDFIGSGCGAGAANCDWNDNMYYIINVRPQEVPSPLQIEDFVALEGTEFETSFIDAFDIGYPGNKLTYDISYQGGDLPTWIQYDSVEGTITGIPTLDSEGSYLLDILATDLNGLTTTSSLTIIVQGAFEDCDPLPAPWLNGDIGEVSAFGAACLDAGKIEIFGSGNDIFDEEDEFHFAYQQLSGNGEIIAKLTSQENTDDWAKAGVMIREDLSDDAIHSFLFVAPNPDAIGNEGYTFQYRDSKGGTTATTSVISNASGADLYLRLTRNGNVLTGYVSETNGNWVEVASQTLAISNEVLIGLAVTSHDDGVLSKAIFEEVAVIREDFEAPILTINGDESIILILGDEFIEPGFAAIDNIDGDITADVIVGGDVVDTNSAGVYVLTYNVSDAAGNMATEVTRTVEVFASDAPALSGLNLVDADSDSLVAELVDGLQIDVNTLVSTNLSIEAIPAFNVESVSMILTGPINNSRTESSPPYALFGDAEGDFVGNNFPLGNYSITVTPYGGNGLSGEEGAPLTFGFVLFDSTVIDETSPVITLSGEESIDLIFGDTFTEPGFTAIDNIDGDITANVNVGGDVVDTNTAGVYVLTYNVSDAAGNEATEVTRTVEVFESDAPALSGLNLMDADSDSFVIELVDGLQLDVSTLASTNLSIEAIPALNVESVSMVLTGPINNSRTESAPPYALFGDASGDFIGNDFPLGNYTITVTPYEGNGLSGAAGTPLTLAFELFDSNFVDTTAPVITLSGSGSIDLILGDVFIEPGFSASDETDGDITANVIVGGDVVDTNTVGVYVLTYNVLDAAGNPATEVTRTVEVFASDAPALSGLNLVDADSDSLVAELVDGLQIDVNTLVSTNLSIEAIPAFNVESVSMVLTGPINNSRTESSPPYALFGDAAGDFVGNNFPLGNYSITVTPYEGNGLSGEAGTPLTFGFVLFDSAIIDETPPVITLSGDESIDLILGDTFIEPGFAATDNLDGDITANVIVGGDVVDTNTAGLYVLTYNVTDAAGNVATEVTRTVEVFESSAPSLSSLNLMDADSDSFVIELVDGLQLDVSTLASTNLSIEAIPALNVESVSMILTGPINNSRTESSPPYALFGDDGNGDFVGNIFPLGNYTITVTPYGGNGLSGEEGTALNLTFELFDSNFIDTTPPTITLNGANPLVLIFGDEFTEPGFAANDETDGDITSNVVIAGDVVDTAQAGVYEVTYNVIDAAGNAATEVTRTVEVLANGDPSLSSLNLVNADSDSFVAELVDGLQIDIVAQGTSNFSIEALPDFNVESVSMVLSGPINNSRTESAPPYALFGDDGNGDFVGNSFPVGTYTITVVPYSENGLGGDQGAALTFTFDLIDSGNAGKPSQTNNMDVTPNPADVEITATLESPMNIREIQIFDFTGRLIRTYTPGETQVGNQYIMGINDLPSGSYIIRLEDVHGEYLAKQMVIKR